MDVRQLSALVAIADHGTFSAAARALFTVQSNVSSHIARLERELGTTLVDRAQGGLTDDGQRVVERARRILREMDEITSDVTAVDGQVSGDVRIGILGTTARWLLPRLLTALEERHPNVRAIVSEGSTSALIPSLLAGRFSAAIIHLPVDDPELVIEPLFAEDLVVVAHREHPLAARGERPLAERRRPPAAAAAARLGAAAGARPGRRHGRRAAAGAGRDRRRAAAGQPGRRTATARRSSRRRRCRRTPPGRFAVVRVPELPPRVVALAYHRRPAPGAPSRALFEVLREVIASRRRASPASASARRRSRSAAPSDVTSRRVPAR